MMTSAEEFIELRISDRREDYLRAANDSASVEVWLDVIKRFPKMRKWVAHNKTVPLEVLFILARDPDPDVRSSVAMKNKLSEDLFVLLANDTDDSVRERVAYNKKAPTRVLKQLAKDPNENISREACLRAADREATTEN